MKTDSFCLRGILGFNLNEVSIREKLVSALGGGLSILILVGLTRMALPDAGAAAVVGSMAASAVLLFAVPHGPLSQPWPILAGHGISAAIGVSCARWIPSQAVAAGCAVGLSILAMLLTRCLHPPSGATAFTAVIGGSAIQEMGYGYVLFPVLANAASMVLLAAVINYLLRWRRAPLCAQPRPVAPPQTRPPTHEEVVAAVRSLDSFVDMSEEDLLRLTELLSEKSKADIQPKNQLKGRDLSEA